MTKPKISLTPQIGKLFLQKYERYLPTAFDGSMTMLEKVNKIIEYMNEVANTVEGAFQDWNSVMEWVMSDGLNESVLVRLDEMVADGTMDTLINEEILGSKARIVLSITEPSNSDSNTYWFLDLGESPFQLNIHSIMVANAELSKEEIEDTDKFWFRKGY